MRRTIAGLQERAGRESAEREARIAALREELAAAGEARRRETRELETRVGAADAVAREAGGRLEIAEAALAAAREGFAAREREFRLQLESERAAARELEAKLSARAVPEAETGPVQAELHRIQELLEEVISRAGTEAVDHARRDAELSTRLQAALEERRLLQERFDRAGAEAIERERRSSSLLQHAIDHSSAPAAERANLPAVVPPDPAPRTPRRRTILAGLAAVTLAALLAIFAVRRATPPRSGNCSRRARGRKPGFRRELRRRPARSGIAGPAATARAAFWCRPRCAVNRNCARRWRRIARAA